MTPPTFSCCSLRSHWQQQESLYPGGSLVRGWRGQRSTTSPARTRSRNKNTCEEWRMAEEAMPRRCHPPFSILHPRIMSSQGHASPYRAPCWGWGGLPTISGGCKQHKVRSAFACGDHAEHHHRPRLPGRHHQRRSAVLGRHARGAAYLKDAINADTSDFCAASPCCCGPWPRTAQHLRLNRIAQALRGFLRPAKSSGFKNLYAQKLWHGKRGFLATNGCDPDDTPVTTHYRTWAD